MGNWFTRHTGGVFISPRTPGFLAAVICLFSLVTAGWDARASLNLPDIPTDGRFIQDYANALPSELGQRIGELQLEAFEVHDTPIIVVTINRMAEYGGAGYSIEDFAYEWFNHWQIGKRSEDGDLINRGILLLVSTGDRQARIELGADWGRGWDRHCSRIMDRQIVPEFRQSDYSAGVEAGVAALAAMAALGPDASPPHRWEGFAERLDESPFETTPVPLWATALMVICGFGMIGMFFAARAFNILFPFPEWWFLAGGILLIVGAFVIWILYILLALLLGRDDHRGASSGGSIFGSGGGFGSSGGFGVGGFSGGGGASGSW